MNVLTIGCFDCLHKGHANLLRRIAEYGEVIAFVHHDRSIFDLKGNWPIQTTSQRIKNLYDAELVKVGNVYIVEGVDPSDLIRWVHETRTIDAFMRGDDMPDFPGRAAVEELGIPISFVSYTEDISSSQRREECNLR